MGGSLKPLARAVAAAGIAALTVALARPASSDQIPSEPPPVDLGISINPGQVGPVPGAYIAGIRAGTAADEAGLRPGDLVVATDGEPLSGPASLPRRLSRHRPGDTVRLEVLRDGRLLGATLRLPAVEEGSSAPPASPPARQAPHAAAAHAGGTAAPKTAHPRYSVGGMGVGYHER
jgi:predicted metalloprotease with PDZ domain